MKKIYKYRLPRDGEVITINADVVQWLNVQEQDGWPHIWAIVDLNGRKRDYVIAAWGTGWEFPDELDWFSYLGTAQDAAGYVWHYFMKDITEENSYDYDYQMPNYDYGKISYTGTPLSDYTITISCGEADSAVSALESKVYGSTDTITQLIGCVTDCATATSVSAH